MSKDSPMGGRENPAPPQQKMRTDSQQGKQQVGNSAVSGRKPRPKRKRGSGNRRSAQQQQQQSKQPPAKRKQTTSAPTSPANARLRVIPLGGLDGIGKNMTVFEYGDDMLLIDAGLMFPDDDHPGIDLILPDYSYVIENEHKLRGIVITHGHEDHTGALPWLLKDLSGRQIPLIATKLTCGLIQGKLEEHGVKNIKYHEVSGGMHLKRGVFGLDFINVNHSIPDAVAVALRTPVGTVLHTGDFKFDQTPIDGRVTDFSALARLGDAGVMLLLSDSTNAETPNNTRSEAEVGKALKRIISQAKQRVVIASFSSHIHRLQQVCDAAAAAGRKVAVTGRSMLRNTRIARELGYLTIPDSEYLDAFEMKDLPADKVVVLCTGSQGEPLSALSRMAQGEHRSVQIEPGDTVILSATPVPGNEKAVSGIINQLTKIGADIYEKRNAEVHVSGHAASEELKLMLNLVRPEYFVPVHGETRHLIAHKKLALQVGIPQEYVFVLENGDVVEFDQHGAGLAEPVQNGVIYVDGLNVGDMNSVVLRDRQHLSKDGIITVVASVSRKRARLIGTPEVVIRGVNAPDPSAFQAEVAARIERALSRSLRENASLASSRGVVKDAVSQFVWERTKTRPMILPVIMEI